MEELLQAAFVFAASAASEQVYSVQYHLLGRFSTVRLRWPRALGELVEQRVDSQSFLGDSGEIVDLLVGKS